MLPLLLRTYGTMEHSPAGKLTHPRTPKSCTVLTSQVFSYHCPHINAVPHSRQGSSPPFKLIHPARDWPFQKHLPTSCLAHTTKHWIATVSWRDCGLHMRMAYCMLPGAAPAALDMERHLHKVRSWTVCRRIQQGQHSADSFRDIMHWNASSLTGHICGRPLLTLTAECPFLSAQGCYFRIHIFS